jgi:hypothetical protein
MTDDPYDVLIDRLRLLREGADLSQVAAGRELGWGSLKVWRIEHHVSRITRTDLTDLLRAYGVVPDGDIWDEYMAMYDEARVQGDSNESPGSGTADE